MMLRKVVSGGQTGADIAGLRAAQHAGLETGGWMPTGCRTTDGPHEDWLTEFGMQEHSGGYKERTWANVEDSDATVRFAVDFGSPGEVCTLKAIERYRKPYFDIDMSRSVYTDALLRSSMANWLNAFDVAVLNVAGHSEKTALFSYEFVYEFLLRLFAYEGLHAR